jgi:hypothetical protein
MPSPRKRAVRAACGNILSGEPDATQLAYADTWWNVVMTEHSNNYAASRDGGKPFNNGESLIIGAQNPDYDGLISGGEPGEDTSIGAYATLTCADGDAASGMTEGEYVSITSASGTVRNYIICAAGESGVPATGTRLAVGADTGASTLADSAPFDVATANNIAVQVTLGGNQGTVLNEIRTAIASTYGHNAGSANSVIQLSAALTPADGEQTMKLQNVTGGTAGNVTITTTISQITVDGFLGGVNAVGSNIEHYWFDTTNANATEATAADSLALTSADGILYDPSGPHSKYIPSLETVSANTAKYVCIAPTGWSANDYISWELIGDTEASNDKLSLEVINGSDVTANLEGVKSDGTIEDVNDAAGTVAYTGRTTYATANAKGILVKFERDGTGAATANIKKGWYFRWSYTAV